MTGKNSDLTAEIAEGAEETSNPCTTKVTTEGTKDTKGTRFFEPRNLKLLFSFVSVVSFVVGFVVSCSAGCSRRPQRARR